MNLTAQNVEDIFMKCLYEEGEDTTGYIPANGVMTKVGFNPIRIAENTESIIEMLNDLPDSFKTSNGGGTTFLNACVDKLGNQWGEHSNIDQLLCLGIAIGKISFPIPKEMWAALPGGMPYVTYKDN
jgi:hypothetical protein